MEFTITAKEQKILLTQAREAILAELEGRKPSFEPVESGSKLQELCGAFVSLHKRPAHRLRGCIGRMTALNKASNLPLIETVRIMAREAAFSDPRFPPVNSEELDRISIEISALSPMTPCPDPGQVKVGVHGLLLQGRGRSGVLLPQVPVEQGWDLDQYLDYICVKAGLPQGSHNDPDTQLYTFTAVVFGEE